MTLRLTVTRSPTEYLATSQCMSYLGADALASLAVEPGALLVLTSLRGRRMLARAARADVGEALAAAGAGAIMLDRFMRRSLRARLGEPLAVEPLEEPQPVRRVILSPAVDITMAHHLEEHLCQQLVQHATPVTEGVELYATFPNSTGGTIYTVVQVEGGPGSIGPETEVELRYTEIHTPEPETTYEDVGGLGREIQLIRELVQFPLTQPHLFRQLGIKPPRGIILNGPPGVGKTLLMRAVAGEVQARFYYVNGPDILGNFGDGESNLRKLFSESAHHAPSILFFDEIDSIAPKRGTSGAHSDTRVVSQLLTLLDGMQQVDGVVAIATTNRVDSLDPALRRPGRFDREIYIGPPTPAGRLEILRIHTREMPLAHDMHATLPWLSEQTHGFVGADLLELCRAAGLNALRRQVGGATAGVDASQLVVETEDFKAALAQVYPSALREAVVTIPPVSWADIGGMAEVRIRLTDLVTEALSEQGGEATHDAILLHGPPGVGKTLIAQATARAAGANLIQINGPEIFTAWVGESEEYLRHLFRLARQLAPCLIFIDQLDAIASRRGADQGTRVNERVVSQLSVEMDVIHRTPRVGVLGATNRPDLIDPALLRSGRFGSQLYIPLPAEADRESIFAVLTRGWRLDGDSAMLAVLAAATAELSGADLAAVCRQARRAAVRRGQNPQEPVVTEVDFHDALAVLNTERVALAATG